MTQRVACDAARHTKNIDKALDEQVTHLNDRMPAVGKAALPSLSALNEGQLHLRPSSSANPGDQSAIFAVNYRTLRSSITSQCWSK
jgi:hypothetical protein